MTIRNPARILAPIALAASVGLVIAVVSAASKHNAGSSGSPAPAAVHAHRHRTYRVRAGDTLSKVSIRTGVSLSQLEQLNPKIDPNALRPGQHIKLR